jgi:hypothetical protein
MGNKVGKLYVVIKYALLISLLPLGCTVSPVLYNVNLTPEDQTYTWVNGRHSIHQESEDALIDICYSGWENNILQFDVLVKNIS